MKRSWAGLGILVFLLILSVMSTSFMVRTHEPIAADLHQAAQYALEGDWEQAERLQRSAEKNWSKTEDFRQFLADHTPVEEVEAGFQLLKVYCQTREAISFAACCADLSAKTAAVGEAHALHFRNLL